MSYTLRKLLSVSGEVIRQRRSAVENTSRRTTCERVLAATASPKIEQSERDFQKLAKTYSGPSEYGYDRKSTWLRGLERAQQIIKYVPELDVNWKVLEVGCGDGMTSLQLEMLGTVPTLTDLRDWRDPRAAHMPFNMFDLGNTGPIPCDGAQDLVFSYNAFEHFPDPESALARMISKVRPGGYLFFEFGPLYAGPWGLHAYRMLTMPYPQFLFSEAFWRHKVKEIGIRDLGQTLLDIQPLNKWTIAQFDDLWQRSGFKVLVNKRYAVEAFVDLALRYPEAFQGRGLRYEDLTTQGVLVLLQKPGR